MPGRSDLDGYDAQDTAEVFDEDNMNPDSDRIAGADGLVGDEMPSLFDVTAAEDDADEDESDIGDDMDDDEIVAAGTDDYDLDEEEGELFEDDDLDARDGVSATGADEVELVDAGDMTGVAGAHSAAQRYESKTLSDKDLEELGYKDKTPAEGPPTVPPAEPKSFGELREHVKTKRAEDERLDQGIEETFPASDPVSVKHIT